MGTVLAANPGKLHDADDHIGPPMAGQAGVDRPDMGDRNRAGAP